MIYFLYMEKLNIEKQIISFLKKKYHPDVIVLVGSRARKDNNTKSDWDLYIYTSKNTGKAGEYISFQNEKLDISIEPVPYPKRYIIKNSFSPIPLSSLQVLYDTSKGKFSKIINNTQIAYQAGPLKFWEKDFDDRKITLLRLIDKISQYEQSEEVQYMYTSAFYEFAPQVYFENKNIWTPSLLQVFEYIRKNDKKLCILFKKLRKANGKIATKITMDIYKYITRK